MSTRLDNIRVHVRASELEIEAELRHRTNVTISLGEGVYDFVDESAIEQVLANILELLWAGWQREYRKVIEHTDLVIDAEDLTDKRFFAERDSVEAVGSSNDKRITLSTVGMKDYSVHITPGTMRKLTSIEFSVGVGDAATELIQDFRDKVGEVKDRHYNY
ncbi:hypothetical protein [Nocardia sp. NPDC057030]|uniref:hypothetical protein n=1 Tax=unclassified Nocardia TaxID=2637762 RepID=UPI00362F948B